MLPPNPKAVTFITNGVLVPLWTKFKAAFCRPPWGVKTTLKLTADNADIAAGGSRIRNAAAPTPEVVTPLITSAVLPELVMLNVLVRVSNPTIAAPKSVPSAVSGVLLLTIVSKLVPSIRNCGIRYVKAFDFTVSP